MSGRIVYKIVDRTAWHQAEAAGEFTGAPVDLADGFIHFSASDQVVETAEKHFSGQRDLLLVAIDSAKLGDRLRWEPSRGGKLFPHLYGPLPVGTALWTKPLEIAGGQFAFPELPDQAGNANQ